MRSFTPFGLRYRSRLCATKFPFRPSVSKPRLARGEALDKLGPTLRYLRASGVGASIPQPERVHLNYAKSCLSHCGNGTDFSLGKSIHTVVAPPAA